MKCYSSLSQDCKQCVFLVFGLSQFEIFHCRQNNWCTISQICLYITSDDKMAVLNEQFKNSVLIKENKPADAVI